MTLLFFFLLIAFALLLIYIIFFWYRNRRKSRFRVQLTILFLLFIMLPVIPLTFLTAHLLTTSARYLTIPGISNAIETSIKTIRKQTQVKGKTFLNQFPDIEQISLSDLKQYDVDFVGKYHLTKDSIICVSSISLNKDNISQNKERILKDIKNKQISYLDDNGTLTYYRYVNDTIFKTVVYKVDSEIIVAKNEISQAMNIYNALSLIKNTILQKNLIWGTAALIVIGMTLLAVFIGKKLSQSISKPVQALVKGMNRIAADNLNQPVDIKAKHEFRFMIDTFNKMMDDLKQTRKKLIQAERLAAWQEVARMISHEIKNSLTPISIALRRIRNKTEKKEYANQTIQESLINIDKEIHSLSNMASKFSEFAKLPSPEKSPVNLNEIINSVVELKKANADNITIITEPKDNLPIINADKYQMRQIFNNLIQNSIDAMDNKGEIRISTSASSSSQHTIQIIIKDNGCGIKPAIKKNIFNPYYTTRERGTGLGLAIVKRVIDEHGGTIRVESEPNKGSTFYIEF
ncbi:MAG: ATP-binding protein [bacterium]